MIGVGLPTESSQDFRHYTRPRNREEQTDVRIRLVLENEPAALSIDTEPDQPQVIKDDEEFGPLVAGGMMTYKVY